MGPTQMQIVGVSTYDFVEDKTDRRVQGTKFHVVRPHTRRNSVGYEATSFTVRSEVIDQCGQPKLNGVYDCVFDPTGRLVSYTLAPKS